MKEEKRLILASLSFMKILLEKHKFFALNVIVFTLLFFIASYPIQLLMVKQDENLMHFRSLAEGESFSVKWTHSVEKEEWEETFIVQNSSMTLVATRFKTFGAGVPNDIGNHTFIQDGWVHMTGIHREIGNELMLRANHQTHHKLYIKEQHYEFVASESSEQFLLTVESIPLASYLYLRLYSAI